MAKKNKSSSKDRGFFRFMTLIGVITIGGLTYAFFNAAPDLSQTEAHINAQQPKGCLSCHVQDIKNAPIMPHRPMQSCNGCHTKK